jgi:hypothetical protein
MESNAMVVKVWQLRFTEIYTGNINDVNAYTPVGLIVG